LKCFRKQGDVLFASYSVLIYLLQSGNASSISSPFFIFFYDTVGEKFIVDCKYLAGLAIDYVEVFSFGYVPWGNKWNSPAEGKA